ncbi:MAG: peptidoglycan bridge formation glycyltransferase FemA/FemB family protein [Candidatus Chisholmbacteria bacterium]|nr:peptidoglycan bridge formation glycyltransferase FemA/FemB family protein [Candidatus Chisholmbacteria bacterium]
MIVTQQITEKNTWENFVLNHPQVNFLHSWNWGEFHRQLNHPIFRLGFYSGKTLRGVALLIYQPAKRGHYLECPGGPLIDWQNQALTSAFFQTIRDYSRQLPIRFLRLRPQVLDTPLNRHLLHQFGCRLAPIHLHAQNTWQLDLDQSEDQILQGMRKTTRYLIRQAQKNITVEATPDPKSIHFLYQLQLQTVKLHGFVPFSRQFLTTQFGIFSADDQALLFLAKHRRQVLAAAMIIFYGPEAVYHYSGSSLKARQFPATYAIQWAAIREAKNRGFHRYNFWGIAPTQNPHHRFAGVTLFKTGFGGYRVDYLPAHDLPLRSSYWLTYLIELFRAKYRRL